MLDLPIKTDFSFFLDKLSTLCIFWFSPSGYWYSNFVHTSAYNNASTHEKLNFSPGPVIENAKMSRAQIRKFELLSWNQWVQNIPVWRFWNLTKIWATLVGKSASTLHAFKRDRSHRSGGCILIPISDVLASYSFKSLLLLTLYLFSLAWKLTIKSYIWLVPSFPQMHLFLLIRNMHPLFLKFADAFKSTYMIIVLGDFNLQQVTWCVSVNLGHISKFKKKTRNVVWLFFIAIWLGLVHSNSTSNKKNQINLEL